MKLPAAPPPPRPPEGADTDGVAGRETAPDEPPNEARPPDENEGELGIDGRETAPDEPPNEARPPDENEGELGIDGRETAPDEPPNEARPPDENEGELGVGERKTGAVAELARPGDDPVDLSNIEGELGRVGGAIAVGVDPKSARPTGRLDGASVVDDVDGGGENGERYAPPAESRNAGAVATRVRSYADGADVPRLVDGTRGEYGVALTIGAVSSRRRPRPITPRSVAARSEAP